MENIAARTVGFSGADLRNLVNEAVLLVGRKGKSKVEFRDFEEAQIKSCLEQKGKINSVNVTGR